MEWLNYHHLLYFWVVAREGGLVQAGKVLHLSHPTLSAQIHALEERLGEKLFVKEGRRLVLTEVGRVAYGYADEIFGLGREMLYAVQGRGSGKPIRLDVGVVDVVPKLIVKRLLEPALGLPEQVRLVCHEDGFDELLVALSLHKLDLVIADAPIPHGSPVRAFNHLLGQCGVGIFGTADLAKAYRRGFPGSLDGAPMVLPMENLPVRRALNRWFDEHGIRPRILAECDDSALMKVLGEDGVGLFPAPLAVGEMHGVHRVGLVEGVRERFYAISVERKLKNAAVVAITHAARHELFGEE
jgi:LysR family transcriptional regulator, transcriptional activator of nhaA